MVCQLVFQSLSQSIVGNEKEQSVYKLATFVGWLWVVGPAHHKEKDIKSLFDMVLASWLMMGNDNDDDDDCEMVVVLANFQLSSQCVVIRCSYEWNVRLSFTELFRLPAYNSFLRNVFFLLSNILQL